MSQLKNLFFFSAIVYTANCALFEGDTCTLESTSQKGICKPIGDCPSALKRYDKSGKPGDICGFDSFIPIVCCPTRIPGEVSKEYCANYSRSLWQVKQVSFALRTNVSTCGKPKSGPLVVGGKKASPKEFPHQTLLGYGEANDIAWMNGGSLISEYFVLTAAHCIETQEHGTVKWIRLGDLNIFKKTDDAMPEEFKIVETLIHPDYRAPKPYNDIALLKFNGPVTFNPYIGPICLQTVDEPDITRFQATGWGADKFGGGVVPDLMKVTVEKFNNDDCNEAYEERRRIQTRIREGILDEIHICAGSKSGKNDTCQGDSGGPLQVFSEEVYCTYKLIGITSFGTACGVANVPGIYTRVSYYIKWIEDYVWPL